MSLFCKKWIWDFFINLLPHIALQHSVGQLSSRLRDDLAYFLKLFLYFGRLVLGVLFLSANEGLELKDETAETRCA